METLRRTACAGIASPAPRGNVGMKSQKIAVVGAGEKEPASPDLVRAGLDVTYIEQWPPARRCGRTGFGSSCRTRLWSHLFALRLEDWMKGRRGEGEDINGLRRADSAASAAARP